ncbi:uncharacterized protein [Onthophagus taurus]|uniref:uncharacterized protein n=1 Tax=Onthophagus taurus TaxID=166361 RepID=UPI000C1FE4CE|nr:uncharacterized protein LOC111414421 [Onthophagus taurus]
MADSKFLYSTCVAILGFVCFVVGATAVGLPGWAYFDSVAGGFGDDRGYFGLWTICKALAYSRERCGKDYSKFRPTVVVWIAGVVGAISVAILGGFCILSIIQMAMLQSKERVVMKYSVLVILKLATSLLATLLSVATAGLFALQTDENNTGGFRVTRGPGFYVQIMFIVLNAILFVMSLYDLIFSRKPGGDPTKEGITPTGGGTLENPGFIDSTRPRHGDISMTDASGKPYGSITNGSMNSVNTTSTTLGSNGSSFTLPKAPARSSLKKKPATTTDGLGIQNPGYSGSSPTFNRNGSMKKVRIQTHSTDV